jgi:hypothetical protein
MPRIVIAVIGPKADEYASKLWRAIEILGWSDRVFVGANLLSEALMAELGGVMIMPGAKSAHRFVGKPKNFVVNNTMDTTSNLFIFLARLDASIRIEDTKWPGCTTTLTAGVTKICTPPV